MEKGIENPRWHQGSWPATEWMVVSLAEMGMKWVWAGMGELVIHVRCLVTVGYMSQERDWAKETDLGLVCIETVFSLGSG